MDMDMEKPAMVDARDIHSVLINFNNLAQQKTNEANCLRAKADILDAEARQLINTTNAIDDKLRRLVERSQSDQDKGLHGGMQV